MSMTQSWAPTIMRVSGDKSVRGQLMQTLDGNLLCDFPERLIMIANHQVHTTCIPNVQANISQIYTDWLYLWWIGYCAGMHGRIYIVLKESLKRIPVLGWGMQFCQFIFLKRNWEKDKPRMAAHLQKFNKPNLPMWLLMFPEGTNLADSTRERSKQWAAKNGIDDMKHQLLPRSTGLQFCLQQLRNTTEWVYDCTIAYEGVPRGEFAQDIYTVKASYFGGRPPKSVNMHWRRFAISSIPLDDSHAFEHWLRARWTEKDNLIEYYYQHGNFPADVGVDKGPDGQTRRGAGYIETQIRPAHWYEFLQIFAPTGLLALILYCFYGALPRRLVRSFSKQAVLDTIDTAKQNQLKGPDKMANYAINTLVSNIGLQNTVAAQKQLVGVASKAFGNTNIGAQKALMAAPKAMQNGAAQRALVDAATAQIATVARSATSSAQAGLVKQQQQNGKKPPLKTSKARKPSVKGAMNRKSIVQGSAISKTTPKAATPQVSSINGVTTKPVENKIPLKKQKRAAQKPSANGTVTKPVENKIPLAKQQQKGVARRISPKASNPQRPPTNSTSKTLPSSSASQKPSTNGVVTKPVQNKIPLAKQQPAKPPNNGLKTKPVSNPVPKALQGKKPTA